jgi:hypothetical protein
MKNYLYYILPEEGSPIRMFIEQKLSSNVSNAFMEEF